MQSAEAPARFSLRPNAVELWLQYCPSVRPSVCSKWPTVCPDGRTLQQSHTCTDWAQTEARILLSRLWTFTKFPSQQKTFKGVCPYLTWSQKDLRKEPTASSQAIDKASTINLSVDKIQMMKNKISFRSNTAMTRCARTDRQGSGDSVVSRLFCINRLPNKG